MIHTVVRILLLVLVIALLADLFAGFDPLLVIMYGSALVGAVAASLVIRNRLAAAVSGAASVSAVFVSVVVLIAAFNSFPFNENERILLVYWLMLLTPVAFMPALVAGWLAVGLREFIGSRLRRTGSPEQARHV